ncbi:uncharacterized protein LOC121855621 [Homarus americanus]|uniref:uncharacterized protein LOC121855621 n=1 Tax=Homarus americanus TaxID=6706 RepID=UPI001C441FB0|nr:uncharacterized protein LOC121855621 [Homarus americanus]
MNSLVVVVLVAVMVAGVTGAGRSRRSASPDPWHSVPIPYVRPHVVQYTQPRYVVQHSVVVPHHPVWPHDDEDDHYDRKKRSAPADESASRQKRSADFDDDLLWYRPAVSPVVYSRPVVRPFVQTAAVRPTFFHPGHLVLGHGYYEDK